MLLYRQRIGKWRDRVLIVLFVLAIWLPLAGFLFGWHVKVRTELRKLASRPELNFHGRIWKGFPGAFDAYFNDHFGFRALLIHWNNFCKCRWLHVSTSPTVLIGRHDWLYYRPLPLTELPSPFTQEELETWQRVLEHRQAWLARRGCRYVLFIPSNKETIYPEYLPDFARPYARVPRLEQLVAHLRQHSTVPILEVREALREASQHEQTYFRTDQHWNDRGAFVGYQHLSAWLSEWFPAIQPLPRSAFLDTDCDFTGDLSLMLGQTREVEKWLALQPLQVRRAQLRLDVDWLPGVPRPPIGPLAFETGDKRLPRAVVFHDSFTIAMLPFLSEHFRRIAYFWSDDFHQIAVEREHPDVVIQELLERKLNFLKPNEIVE